MLESFFTIIIWISLIVVFIILAFGIVAMTSGGKFNKNWSQKLMRMRVIGQGVVVLLLVIFLGFIKN